MSVTEDLPDVDGAELLGLLFQDGENGIDESFFPDGKALIEDWLAEQDMLPGMDTEDFLSSLLEGEGNMATIGPSHSPLGSDSGISDDSSTTGGGSGNTAHLLTCPSPQGSNDSDPAPSPAGSDPASALAEYQMDSPEALAVQTDHSYSLLQSAGADLDALQSVRAERPDMDVFIDLDDFEGDVMEEELSDALPYTLSIEDATLESTLLKDDDQFQFKDIVLTEEEKRLLAKEGATLPSHMPLTKAEERTLKRVRRKIRNKQSAQESRKKKKVYVDGLENRVAICTVHNLELQKKVELLQKQNISLIEQLKKLQAMMKMSTMKMSTTSTCIMVFLFSFCLIIFPSVNPFGGRTGQKELYTPSSVMSRTLRSLPSDSAEALSYVESEEEQLHLLPADKVVFAKALFSGRHNNHTPDFQRVERPDSETGVTSNSSADFPGPGQASDRAPPPAPAEPGLASAAALQPATDYDVSGSKENWIERKPTSVILQQHRSDEM